MPRHIVPHKSGVHRIAAISLYRALLKQCKALALPSPQVDESRNLIRNRFGEQRHVTSHRQLRISFTAGYEAIDHLDNAVAGHDTSRNYLVDLLTRAPADAKQPSQRMLTKKESDAQRKADSRSARDGHNRTPKLSLWDRPIPLQKLSGKRHVPILFNANRIPVLRLKKPQPESLSTYINARILQRQKRHDRRMRLEGEMDWAMAEDRWDQVLQAYCGVVSPKREPWWRAEVGRALGDVRRALMQEKEKNKVMAEKMQGVVDRETELFESEQREERLSRKKVKIAEMKQAKFDLVQQIAAEAVSFKMLSEAAVGKKTQAQHVFTETAAQPDPWELWTRKSDAAHFLDDSPEQARESTAQNG